MRVTDRRGVSWPDPAYPGVRHWASRSVSYWWPWPLALAWWVLVVPYLALMWLGAETWIWVTLLLCALVQWAWWSWRLGVWLPFHVEHHRHWYLWWPAWKERP